MLDSGERKNSTSRDRRVGHRADRKALGVAAGTVFRPATSSIQYLFALVTMFDKKI